MKKLKAVPVEVKIAGDLPHGVSMALKMVASEEANRVDAPWDFGCGLYKAVIVGTKTGDISITLTKQKERIESNGKEESTPTVVQQPGGSQSGLGR